MDPTLMNKVRLPKINVDENFDIIKDAVFSFFNPESKTFNYQNLYRTGYQLTISQKGSDLYERLEDWIISNIKILMNKIRAVDAPGAFLKSVEQIWHAAKIAISMTNEILLYFQEHYINRSKLDGIKYIGYSYFSHIILTLSNSKRISNAILAEVNKSRDGELIDQSLIKNISEMLREIDIVINKNDYRINIETPYLNNVKEEYTTICEKLISESAIPNFLLETENIISREAARAENLLSLETKFKVSKYLKEIFIYKNMERFLITNDTWIISLIQQDRSKELAVAYKLFFDQTYMPMVKRFEEAITNAFTDYGIKLIHQPISEHNCKSLIDLIINIIEKFNNIWVNQFFKNEEIHVSIEKALTSIINCDGIIIKALGQYYNFVLSKRSAQLSEPEQEKALKFLFIIFKYIISKDRFVECYTQLMANRLLNGSLKSDDSEREIISKFKAEYGMSYTQKMESMMKDVVSSKNECNEFLGNIVENYGLNFEIFIMSHGLWPLDTWSINFKLIPNLEAIRKSYETFYLNKHKGRKLNWKMSKSTIEFTGYFSVTNKKYSFCANVMEALILLMFNEANEISISEIESKFNIPKEEAKNSLKTLMNIKLLINGEKENTYKINEKYANRRMSVRIPSSTVKIVSQNEENKELDAIVYRERGQKIDATLVKIMKSRHKESHNILITDTIKILSPYFPVDRDLVKLRIEHLIEADYIERLKDDRRYYSYIA